MNGANETKSTILLDLSQRMERVWNGIEKINDSGCSVGKIHDEQIRNVNFNLGELKKIVDNVYYKVDAINAKLMWGLMIVGVIAFLAGINIMNFFLAKGIP